MKTWISTFKSFPQLKLITSLFLWNNLYEFLRTNLLHTQMMVNGPPSAKFPPWLEPLVTPLARSRRV